MTSTAPALPDRAPTGGPPAGLRLRRPDGDALPPVESARRRRTVQGLASLALAASVGYLLWRVLFSLDGASPWLAVPLLLLEVHALVGLALFAHDLWDVDVRPVPGPGTEGLVDVGTLRVAVLVPTYDEPRSILLPTVAAAVGTRHPHETWVLDDGDRPWVREMAEELGARYRSRHEGAHAKAGNINDALPEVGADVVAVIDADHVVSERFLEAVLPYFADPGVAVVQSPQEFYNDSSFEHAARRGGKVYAEQELFYRGLLAGRNRWGAAFWCGTNAAVRVAALDSVGGVATDSVTEDIQTTLRLHRKGWRTVHHNEVLAYGLAADDPRAFFIQRCRWGAGAMQVLHRDSPFTGRGLTLHQRLSYASTLLGWFDSWRTIGYVVLPVLTVLTGWMPVSAPVAAVPAPVPHDVRRAAGGPGRPVARPGPPAARDVLRVRPAAGRLRGDPPPVRLGSLAVPGDAQGRERGPAAQLPARRCWRCSWGPPSSPACTTSSRSRVSRGPRTRSRGSPTAPPCGSRSTGCSCWPRPTGSGPCSSPATGAAPGASRPATAWRWSSSAPAASRVPRPCSTCRSAARAWWSRTATWAWPPWRRARARPSGSRWSARAALVVPATTRAVWPGEAEGTWNVGVHFDIGTAAAGELALALYRTPEPSATPGPDDHDGTSAPDASSGRVPAPRHPVAAPQLQEG